MARRREDYLDYWGNPRMLAPGMVLASDGFPRRNRASGANSAEPVRRHERVAKLRAKLERRIKVWEDGQKSRPGPVHQDHKPGSLK